MAVPPAGLCSGVRGAAAVADVASSGFSTSRIGGSSTRRMMRVRLLRRPAQRLGPATRGTSWPHRLPTLEGVTLGQLPRVARHARTRQADEQYQAGRPVTRTRIGPPHTAHRDGRTGTRAAGATSSPSSSTSASAALSAVFKTSARPPASAPRVTTALRTSSTRSDGGHDGPPDPTPDHL